MFSILFVAILFSAAISTVQPFQSIKALKGKLANIWLHTQIIHVMCAGTISQYATVIPVVTYKDGNEVGS